MKQGGGGGGKGKNLGLEILIKGMVLAEIV